MSALDGVLVIDKPPGMTSHDVVDVVRKRFGTKKVGHGGTLDPDATGVLLLGLGRATRFLAYAQASPKRYTAVARLGVTTSTQDASGHVVEERGVAIGAGDIQEAMVAFRGDIEQIPPMVSAVKVGGERLYKKARRGEEVERQARPVSIFKLELVDFSAERAEATFDLRCSGGTYVRTLVHDLGAVLGCGAHVSSLRRTEAGGFPVSDAVPLEAVGTEHLRPPVDVVASMPRLEVDDATARTVSHGGPLESDAGVPMGVDHVALVHNGALLAVYRRSGGRLVADRVVGS